MYRIIDRHGDTVQLNDQRRTWLDDLLYHRAIALVNRLNAECSDNEHWPFSVVSL